jgi:DNA-binding NarL/FixJ family response regulator
MKNTRILIADDHPLTLHGTKSFVASLGYTVVDTCDNGITALNLIQLHLPDIAILDINMNGLNGIDILKQVYEKKLPVKVVFVTMHKEMSIYKFAATYNAFGYVLKEHAFDELEKCLLEVSRGERYLSQTLAGELIHDVSDYDKVLEKLSLTERKIVELIAHQKTSRQIADLLFISEKTVEGHRRNIIEKLNLPKEKNSLTLWVTRNIKPK